MELVRNFLAEVVPHVDFNPDGDKDDLVETLLVVGAVNWYRTPVHTALVAIARWLDGGEFPTNLVEEALEWVRERKSALLREYPKVLVALAEKYRNEAPLLSAALSTLAEALEGGVDQQAAVEAQRAAVEAIEGWYGLAAFASEGEAARRGLERGYLRGVVFNSLGPLYNLEIGLSAARRLLPTDVRGV